MDKVIFDEIIKLEQDVSMTKGNAMILMSKFAPVELKYDDSYNVYYSVSTHDILSSNISEGELIKLVIEGGWVSSKDGMFLQLYI